MKRLLITFLSLSLCVFLSAQESSSNNRIAYFSPTLGIGGFSPSDVNSIILDQYPSDLYSSTINTNMYLFYHIGLNGSFFISRFFEIQVGAEIAGSPKFIFDDNNDEMDYYGYRRVTPNAKFNFHIPTGRITTVVLGTGVSYNALRLKSPNAILTGNDFGYSLQMGVRLQFSKNFGYAPILVFNSIQGKSGFYDLNYTGVQLNNTFYF